VNSKPPLKRAKWFVRRFVERDSDFAVDFFGIRDIPVVLTLMRITLQCVFWPLFILCLLVLAFFSWGVWENSVRQRSLGFGIQTGDWQTNISAKHGAVEIYALIRPIKQKPGFVHDFWIDAAGGLRYFFRTSLALLATYSGGELFYSDKWEKSISEDEITLWMPLKWVVSVLSLACLVLILLLWATRMQEEEGE